MRPALAAAPLLAASLIVGGVAEASAPRPEAAPAPKAEARLADARFGGSARLGRFPGRTCRHRSRTIVIRNRIVDDHVVPGRISRPTMERSIRETVRSRNVDDDGVILDPACSRPGCVAPEPRRGSRIVVIERGGDLLYVTE